MDKYYYFVSQLPMLSFDKETYITIDGFLQEAKKWLSQNDYITLSAVNIADVSLEKNNKKVLKEYKQFEFQLRTDILQWREALQSGQEHKPNLFPVSIVKDGNPLEVEKKLLLLRWDFIDEIEREHHFDLGYLIIYYLKLQILYKLVSFDKEQGLKTFQNICEVEA